MKTLSALSYRVISPKKLFTAVILTVLVIFVQSSFAKYSGGTSEFVPMQTSIPSFPNGDVVTYCKTQQEQKDIYDHIHRVLDGL